MLVDSHCHLDFPDLASRLGDLMANMRDNEVSHALCVSVNLEDFPRVLALAEAHPNLFASVGVHPDYENLAEPQAAQLASLARHPPDHQHEGERRRHDRRCEQEQRANED